MRRPPKIIFLWFLNLIVLAAGLGLSYLIWREAELTINNYQETYLLARGKANLVNWRQTLAASAVARAAVAAAFVSPESLIGLIEELETVARESGVDLELDEPLVETTTFNLSLGAKGSFPNLYRWLGRLENLPYRLVFEKIDLTGGGVNPSQDGVNWNVRLALQITSFN